MNTTHGCDASDSALVAAGLMAGAVVTGVPGDRRLGALTHWNSGQSHVVGKIDDRPVVRTSARMFPPPGTPKKIHTENLVYIPLDSCLSGDAPVAS